MVKILMMFCLMSLAISCQKNDTTADQGSAPNTSTQKDGSDAGTGSGGSLGTSN